MVLNAKQSYLTGLGLGMKTVIPLALLSLRKQSFVSFLVIPMPSLGD